MWFLSKEGRINHYYDKAINAMSISPKYKAYLILAGHYVIDSLLTTAAIVYASDGHVDVKKTVAGAVIVGLKALYNFLRQNPIPWDGLDRRTT